MSSYTHFPVCKNVCVKLASLAMLSKEILFCINVYFDASKSLNKTIETGEKCIGFHFFTADETNLSFCETARFTG